MEIKLMSHVPHCQVSACKRRVPVPFPPSAKSTWGLAELRGTFSQYFAVSSALFLQGKIYRQLQGYSKFGRYSLCSGVFFQSPQGHLGDMGQSDDLVSLLFWEVIVYVMVNSTYKLAAFGTTSSLGQKVCQIFFILMCISRVSPIATDSRIAW